MEPRMKNDDRQYRREVARLAAEPRWVDALCVSPLATPEGCGAVVKHSTRCGLWADYLHADDGEESIDAGAWDAYGPAIAFYALWWDAYLARIRRK